jgi:putative hydrolase of the HAD superfamily
MIPQQVPTRVQRMPVVWSEPRMQPAAPVATFDARVRQCARGGLIVDLDDTLYPREHFMLSGLAAVARHVARTFDMSMEAAFQTMLRAHRTGQRGREFQALCSTYKLPVSMVPELVSVFREHRPSLWLAAGVVDTLQILRQQGWRIAVLTNGLPSVQASKVAALDLARVVDHVLCAEQYAPGGKPSPAAFHAAVARLGLPPAWCLCVGDDPVNDIQGAQAAGLRAVQVMRPGVAVRHDADALIESFDDLPAVAASLVTQVAVDVA